MKTVGIVPNHDKEEAMNMVREIVDFLVEKECKPAVTYKIAEYAGVQEYGVTKYELYSKSDFIVGKGFTQQELLEIISIRYAMSANGFQKYIGTTISADVCEETVAIIKENSEELPGVDITAETIRKYVDGPYFSHIMISTL